METRFSYQRLVLRLPVLLSMACQYRQLPVEANQRRLHSSTGCANHNWGLSGSSRFTYYSVSGWGSNEYRRTSGGNENLSLGS
jgi:hypothetical protein